jgi:sec-independent protein translocase protein TatA
MGWDAPWHWVIVAIVVILLFGYKKLPDASRSLGRSLRIFKTEIKGMTEDDKARAKATEADEPVEPKALPPAEIVKNDISKPRPRPAPSANGRADSRAKAE